MRAAESTVEFFKWLWFRKDTVLGGHMRPFTLALGGTTAATGVFLLGAAILSTLLLGPHIAAAATPQVSWDQSTVKIASTKPVAASSAKISSVSAKPQTAAISVSDVPADVMSLYRDAATQCGMPWEVLAAVGEVETNHGRSNAPGVHNGSNYAGAQGPMQFMPDTWARYGVDGNRDGRANVYDERDAIPGAANYLCANGAGDTARIQSALWQYNHDGSYVASVLNVAAGYRRDGYVLPLPGAPDYSRPHHDYSAIDIPVSAGTPVYAVHKGTVSTINDSTCGRGVTIAGTDGARYTFCHASEVKVRNGQSVDSGSVIMLSGGQPGTAGAGDSTGPHLHLQITVNGHDVCPQPLLASWSKGKFADPGTAPAGGCSY